MDNFLKVKKNLPTNDEINNYFSLFIISLLVFIIFYLIFYSYKINKKKIYWKAINKNQKNNNLPNNLESNFMDTKNNMSMSLLPEKNNNSDIHPNEKKSNFMPLNYNNDNLLNSNESIFYQEQTMPNKNSDYNDNWYSSCLNENKEIGIAKNDDNEYIKMTIYLYYSMNCGYSREYLNIWNDLKTKIKNNGKLNRYIRLINVDITSKNNINVYSTDNYLINKSKLLTEVDYVPLIVVENLKGKSVIVDDIRPDANNIEQFIKKFSN